MNAMIAEPLTDAAPLPANTHPEPSLPPRASVGMRLAAARKAKGLSIEAAHFGTKVKVPYLIAIEAGDRAALPATPFAAGFVKSYAQFLGLPPDQTAREWRAEVDGETAPPPQSAPAPRPAPIILVSPIIAPKAAPAPRPASEVAPTAAEQSQSLFIAPPLKTALLAGVAILGVFAYFAAQSEGRKSREASRDGAKEERSEAPVVAETKAVAEAPEAATAPGARNVAVPAVALHPPAEDIGPLAEAAEESLIAKEPTAPNLASRGPEASPEPEATAPAQSEDIIKTPLAIAEASPEPAAIPESLVIAEAPREEAVEIATPVVAAIPAPAEPALKFTTALLLKQPRPIYPDRCSAKAAAIESVTVSFSVGVDGAVSGVKAVKATNACFEAAAVSAASKMRFAPALLGGAPTVETGRTATLQFRQE
jgi:TonB family protein